jgi:hypothetical protein
MNIDASEIIPGLFQGSAPVPGPYVRMAGFSAVVFCAMEFQPPPDAYEGVAVIYAPNDDNPERPPTREQLSKAIAASKQVALRVQAGQRVLVTCRMGINRSGLVSALAVHRLTGWPGVRCIQQVQARRLKSLRNPQFCALLARLEPRPSVRVSPTLARTRA